MISSYYNCAKKWCVDIGNYVKLVSCLLTYVASSFYCTKVILEGRRSLISSGIEEGDGVIGIWNLRQYPSLLVRWRWHVHGWMWAEPGDDKIPHYWRSHQLWWAIQGGSERERTGKERMAFNWLLNGFSLAESASYTFV